MSDCVFCSIAAGEIPSEVVYSDDLMLVFKDVNPKADVHLVGIPRQHFSDVAEFSLADSVSCGVFIKKLAEIGRAHGDFKLIFNTGAGVGQTVFHVHGHILAGKITGEV
ncbi:MAG: HIT domain-containing protein [Candidatus Ancillula sp.]|jgi:histidine triad (HIT) family protein|nr:HIT domain-containing protein [Candidatus Ancillula sp.]